MWMSKLRIVSCTAEALVFTGFTCAAPLRDLSTRKLVIRDYDYVPDDALDSSKVTGWLQDHGIDSEKLVFYTKREGENKIFVESDFISGFGEVNTQDSEIAEALSVTLAEYASGIVRAFNNNPSGGNRQYWEIELETLQDNDDVEWIYDMHDGATDADDYADVLKGKEEDSDDEEVEDEDAEGEDDDGIF